MRALRITCFLLAVLVLSTQGIRHLYIKYFETTASVLDRFDKKAVESEIEKATSVDELLAMYEPAKKREDALDATMKEQEKEKPEDKREAFRTEFRKQHEGDYNQAWKLHSAIVTWESKAKEIRELRIFWAFGLGLFVLGGLIYLKWPWLGMAFIVPGVVEMIWWTSPSFRMFGSVQEYDRLLTNKLAFTIASLGIVLVGWFLAGRVGRERTG